MSESIPTNFLVPHKLFWADFIKEVLEEYPDCKLHKYTYWPTEKPTDESQIISIWLENGQILPAEIADKITFTRKDWRGGYYTLRDEKIINPPNVSFKKVSEAEDGAITWDVSAGRMSGECWIVVTKDNEILSVEKSEWGWRI